MTPRALKSSLVNLHPWSLWSTVPVKSCRRARHGGGVRDRLAQFVRIRVGLCPAEQAPAEHVEDRTEVEPALVRRDVGDVAEPQLVGFFGVGVPFDESAAGTWPTLTPRRLDLLSPTEPAMPSSPMIRATRFSLSGCPFSTGGRDPGNAIASPARRPIRRPVDPGGPVDDRPVLGPSPSCPGVVGRARYLQPGTVRTRSARSF